MYGAVYGKEALLELFYYFFAVEVNHQYFNYAVHFYRGNSRFASTDLAIHWQKFPVFEETDFKIFNTVYIEFPPQLQVSIKAERFLHNIIV